MTTIKINNKTITIANKSNESLSFDTLDKESKALESLAIDISKSIEALNIVSNIKAMESFGYKSTEGVSEKIKAGVKVVWDKVVQFFKSIGKFFKTIFAAISNISINAKLKKLEKMDTAKITDIIDEYMDIILNNQDSEKGKRLMQAYRAQEIFGEDFNKPFDPITETLEAIKRFSFNGKIDYSDVTKGKHTLDNIKSKIDDFLKNRHQYVIVYNKAKILEAAINEAKAKVIETNVNNRIKELDSLNDAITKQVEIISNNVNKVLENNPSEYSNEALMASVFSKIAQDLTYIGGKTKTIALTLTKIKPAILDFYNYLNNYLAKNMANRQNQN